MNIPNLSSLKGAVKLGKNLIMAHRPELLYGTSVAATLAAVGLAGKGGYEAGQRVLEAEHPSYDLSKPEEALSAKEKAQLTWSCYAPAALATVGAIGSTTGLHIVHVQEKKALAVAALAAIDEIKDEVADANEKTMQTLEANANKKGVVKTIGSDGEIEELYLVRDAVSGRDIWSNEQRIADAINSLNGWIAKHGDSELNHFYALAGFGEIPMGDDLGWSGDFVEIKWDGVLRDDGRPVRRFTFLKKPKEGDHRF